MSDLFLEAEHAELYRKYRPRYPKEIFEIIDRKLTESTAKLPDGLKEKYKRNREGRWKRALDVGCGTGQATLMLLDSVQEIVGLDSSDSQIHQAKIECGDKDASRVTFLCEDALKISEAFEEDSIDLILVCQAIHWFDRANFFRECLKVLRPGGVLALVGYGLPFFNDEVIDKLNREYIDESLKDSPIRSTIDDKYAEVIKELRCVFPCVERDDSIVQNLDSTVDEYVGYLSTWSNYRTYKRTNPPYPDVLEVFRQKLQKCVPGDAILKRKFDFFIVFGIKSLK
ncbi:hypothetical protein HELRODRAFT_172299 [Helobdella robusta]|uniref:Methyltransferase type 11 domain-containing protein n=1 Tax=Helobdella robusta TaxID=6412 RepID=T1F569_HELRO|nr:hypothetical protein HELRODRAFT_172299 [Helobdella robusta]ESO04634.1 hypothetical protein HELRODRAFT_172299 [Helobdella robusta]